MKKLYELKCSSATFKEISEGEITQVVCIIRDFKVGDQLCLMELGEPAAPYLNPVAGCTGAETIGMIHSIDYGPVGSILEGTCMVGIRIGECPCFDCKDFAENCDSVCNCCPDTDDPRCSGASMETGDVEDACQRDCPAMKAVRGCAVPGMSGLSVSSNLLEELWDHMKSEDRRGHLDSCFGKGCYPLEVVLMTSGQLKKEGKYLPPDTKSKNYWEEIVAEWPKG